MVKCGFILDFPSDKYIVGKSVMMTNYDYSSSTESEGEQPAHHGSSLGESLVPGAYKSAVPVLDSDPCSDDSVVSEESQGPVKMAARAYQLEMLEASLERNIIVAVSLSNTASFHTTYIHQFRTILHTTLPYTRLPNLHTYIISFLITPYN